MPPEVITENIAQAFLAGNSPFLDWGYKVDYDFGMKKSKSKPKKKTPTKAKAKKTVTKKVAPHKVDPKNKSGIMPLGERVLVKPFTAEESGRATSFGIIIPETIDKEKAEQGTVVAVGPGKKNENGSITPLTVTVGDKIMFSKYGFDEIKVNGVEYYILPESSILAILD